MLAISDRNEYAWVFSEYPDSGTYSVMGTCPLYMKRPPIRGVSQIATRCFTTRIWVMVFILHVEASQIATKGGHP